MTLPLLDPPPPFSFPTVVCPSCSHGIDPHGVDPGGPCGVGDEHAVPCACFWSPNDIAADLMQLTRVEEPLLTDGEHEVVRLLGQAFSVWSKEGVAGKDMDEFVAIIHQGQHMIMAQAAARAYPDLYRLARVRPNDD